MTPQWRDFLAHEGAAFAADTEAVAHFGNPEAERWAAAAGAVLVDLSPLSVIRAEGPDAQQFLHAQLTNDIRSLDTRHHLLAAWCNAQGRMLALLRLWRRGEAFVLLLPAERREAVLRRLRQFVLRAKVELDSLDTALARLGVSGPAAAGAVREAAGFVPEGSDTALTQGEVSVLSLPGPFPRYLLAAPYDRAAALWRRLRDHGMRPAGFEVWTWLDIQAGLPQVYDATAESLVPQMVNLDLLGGVSFTKGCYPGQEIVSRLHHRGGLKQRLYRLHMAESTPRPLPGMPVHSPAQAGQSAGTVVESAPSPHGGFDLLAVLQITAASAGRALRLAGESGPVLKLDSAAANGGDQKS